MYEILLPVELNARQRYFWNAARISNNNNRNLINKFNPNKPGTIVTAYPTAPLIVDRRHRNKVNRYVDLLNRLSRNNTQINRVKRQARNLHARARNAVASYDRRMENVMRGIRNRIRRSTAATTVQRRYRNMFRMSRLPNELGATVITNPMARRILKSRITRSNLLQELLNKVKRVEPVNVKNNGRLTRKVQNILRSIQRRGVTLSTGTMELTPNNGNTLYKYFPNRMELRVLERGKLPQTYRNVRPPLSRQNQPMALGNLRR